jgi:hypothetical protein
LKRLAGLAIRLAADGAPSYDETERKERALKLKVLIYEAEEGCYWAKVPAIPGCVSQGETLDEVKANILDALEGAPCGPRGTGGARRPALEEIEV